MSPIFVVSHCIFFIPGIFKECAFSPVIHIVCYSVWRSRSFECRESLRTDKNSRLFTMKIESPNCRVLSLSCGRRLTFDMSTWFCTSDYVLLVCFVTAYVDWITQNLQTVRHCWCCNLCVCVLFVFVREEDEESDGITSNQSAEDGSANENVNNYSNIDSIGMYLI